MQRFKRTDENADKKVIKDELKENRFAKRMPHFVDNYFTKNDLNNNGTVTKGEIIEQTKNTILKITKEKNEKYIFYNSFGFITIFK